MSTFYSVVFHNNQLFQYGFNPTAITKIILYGLNGKRKEKKNMSMNGKVRGWVPSISKKEKKNTRLEGCRLDPIQNKTI